MASRPRDEEGVPRQPSLAGDELRAEHDSTLEALRRAETRYRLLRDSLRDPFVQVAMDGRIIDLNEHYCRMLGYTESELRALTYKDLTPERWHATEERIVREQIVSRGYSDVYEKEYRHKDGTVFPVELRTILSRDEDGAPSAMWAIVRDISERKRAERELREANARLEEADRQKNAFLAVLSHELRNPLAPIHNSLFLLQHAEPGSTAARHALEIITRQTAQLTRLVDDLLDVTRIARNKITLRLAPVELNALVGQTVGDLLALFEERGITVETRLAPQEFPLFGDEVRLVQAVGNLLQNAAKFTPPGGRVVVTTAPGRPGFARVEIADTGIGIDPIHLSGLFQPFYQAHAAQDRSGGGLGLGLALVKSLVEMHAGTVHAHSDGLGCGARFVIELPI